MLLNITSASLETPIGILLIHGDESGICAIDFGQEAHQTEQVAEPVKLCVQQLKEYFAKERKEFDLPLKMEGTSFQKSVWNELLKVPYGQTHSYLELSKKIGNPDAIRAVGTANGSNKIPIIVPCHRIIGSDGSLTGYASGIWRKKILLELEQDYKQLSLF